MRCYDRLSEINDELNEIKEEMDYEIGEATDSLRIMMSLIEDIKAVDNPPTIQDLLDTIDDIEEEVIKSLESLESLGE